MVATDELDAWMDGALAPLRLLVEGLAVVSEPLLGPPLDGALDAPREGMYVEEMRITLPFELDVRVQDDGRVRLAGAPPTQYTRTSVMPVFHSLSLVVKAKPRDA